MNESARHVMIVECSNEDQRFVGNARASFSSLQNLQPDAKKTLMMF
jgi:hypothetical protein